MEKCKKECFNCRWYSPAYTKGFHRFDKQSFGTCRRDKIVQKHDSCAQWQYNTETNKKTGKALRRSVSFKALNEILQHLSEINQILQEEQPEE